MLVPASKYSEIPPEDSNKLYVQVADEAASRSGQIDYSAPAFRQVQRYDLIRRSGQHGYEAQDEEDHVYQDCHLGRLALGPRKQAPMDVPPEAVAADVACVPADFLEPRLQAGLMNVGHGS